MEASYIHSKVGVSVGLTSTRAVDMKGDISSAVCSLLGGFLVKGELGLTVLLEGSLELRIVRADHQHCFCRASQSPASPRMTPISQGT